MTRVFQEGYDARFGVTMSIPVLIQELMIRSLWVIKKRYFEKKDWKECIQLKTWRSEINVTYRIYNFLFNRWY